MRRHLRDDCSTSPGPMDPIDSGQGQENPSEQNSDLTPSSRGRQRKKNPKYQDYETEDSLDEKKTTGRKSSGEGAASKRTLAKRRKAENDPELPENDVENEANHKTPQEPDEITAKETPKKVVRAKKTPTKRTPGRKKKDETPNTDVALPHLEGGVADSAQQENGMPKPKRKYVKKQRAQVIAEPPPCAALSEPEEEIQPGGRRRRAAAKEALKYLHNLAKEALAHPGDETASQPGADSDVASTEPDPKEKGKRLKGSKDVQQLLVSKEELPPEQQEWSHILDQEDTKPQHIKEEHEELWSSQEEEQLQGLEEADTTKFPFTPVSVKSEDDEEKPQSSQLHQRQTEQMETGVDGEDCGGADPERRLQPETEVETEDSYEAETDDSDDWQETGEHLSELNLKNKKLKTGKRPHEANTFIYTTSSAGD
ncbi:neurofilament heavy polypeptide-like [Labrus mixtus]|uniref:neurofilament heavy polypeptide-like n=1 Tax=Labrus mixtus TaxID=508554 RepID=UPI0029C071F6|nr:neurofilament heavy polypeptide-like [Labrus mixtus]